MRIICTIAAKDQLNPYAFSSYLASQGIDNQLEELVSSEGTGHVYQIWVIDEDLIDQATDLFTTYKKDPHHPRYRVAPKQPEESFTQKPAPQVKRRRFASPISYGPVTIITLALVLILFIWVQVEKSSSMRLPKLKGIVEAPFLPPIERKLLYDYPTYFQERDHLFTLWTPADIKAEKPPSKEAIALIHKLQGQTVWMGIYHQILNTSKNKEDSLFYMGPLYEKISEGEVWRIFTPALLHFDLLHIFFNVLWFIILGKQVERRIGSLRFLLLIIASAIISNSAQYLMSGPFFMGLSGVICALAAFIWARQQVAPWEGYLLHRFTLIFLGVFVVGMFGLSVVLFFLQFFQNMSFAVNIANTAHLSGALVGYLLGRTHLFASKL